MAKNISKQTKAILKDQKSQYQQILQKHVKNGEKVTTAAKHAGAEYREKFGKDPRTRYKNALKQASAEHQANKPAAKKPANKKQAAQKPASKKSAKSSSTKKSRSKAAKTSPKSSWKPKYRVGDFFLDSDNLYVIQIVEIKDKSYGFEFRTHKPGAKRAAYKPGIEVEWANESTLDKLRKLTPAQGRSRVRKYQEAERMAAQKKANDERKKSEEQEEREFKESLKYDKAAGEKLAKQSGLSEQVIKDLFAISCKESLRPHLAGIYFDPDGYAVATDAHMIASVRCKVPSSLSGKVIAPNGKTREGKFPAWRSVIEPMYLSGKETSIRIDDEIKKAKSTKAHYHPDDYKKKDPLYSIPQGVYTDCPKVWVVAAKYAKVLSLVRHLTYVSVPICVNAKRTKLDGISVFYIETNTVKALIMPIYGYQED